MEKLKPDFCRLLYRLQILQLYYYKFAILIRNRNIDANWNILSFTEIFSKGKLENYFAWGI